MGHLGGVARLDRSWLVRLDLFAYLLMPALQTLVGIAFVVSIVFAIVGVADFWQGGGWWLLLVLFFGLGGVFLGCLARGARNGVVGILTSLLIIPVYAAYSWLIFPVLVRAVARQALGRRDWAKTAREPVASAPAEPSDA